MSDLFGANLMYASAAESVFDRELRSLVEREVMSNPPAAIPPVPGAVAPVLIPGSDYGSKVTP